MENKSSTAIKLLQKQVSDAASICVKCGLCLPYCPTYKLNRLEGESPRGRLQLMKAYAEDQISWTTKTHTYLDHCLSCQACEPVCPAQVPYGKIKNDFHKLIYISQKPKLGYLPYWLKLFIKFGWFRNWIIKFKIFDFLKKLNFYLNKTPLKLEKLFPRPFKWILQDTNFTDNAAIKPSKIQNVRLKVGILPGCTTPFAEAQLQNACLELFSKLDIDAQLLSSSLCCGALHEHAGDSVHAKIEFNKMIKNAENLHLDSLIIHATGCTAAVKAIKSNGTENHSLRILDILQFLSIQDWTKLEFLPANDLKVFVHEPCTQVNSLNLAGVTTHLIKRIPHIKLIQSSTRMCCGAAGVHALNYPELAQQYLQPMLEEIIKNEVSWVVTANIGCLIHLRQALKMHNKDIKISHPAVLLNGLTKKTL